MNRVVTDFITDMSVLNTQNIQKAIDSCQDGDTLVFPEGIYRTGTLSLKSNLTVQLQKHAVLLGSGNIEDYYDCGFYHNEMKETTSLFFLLNGQNVKFTGEGTIDFNGKAFADYSHFAPEEIKDSMTPAYEEQCVVDMKKRPTQPIFFHNCRHIEFEKITLKDSPCWTLVFSDCRFVSLHDLKIINDKRIPNNDGIHCSASQNIEVRNCDIDVGDDCFAGTCITDKEGVCKNILIKDCKMKSRSAAIRFGHLYSKVQNAMVQNVTIADANRGIAIFAGDDGFVSALSFDHIVCKTQTYSGRWWGKGEGFVVCAENSTGKIENISIEECSFAQQNPSMIYGENVKDVQLKNVTFSKMPNIAHPYYLDKADLQPNLSQLFRKDYDNNETVVISKAEVFQR